jgi:hypothetical protein
MSGSERRSHKKYFCRNPQAAGAGFHVPFVRTETRVEVA